MKTEYPKLPPKFKAKWIKALRSGAYKQMNGQVCEIDNDGNETYCCIGVGGRVCGYSTDMIGRCGILPRDLKRVPNNFRHFDVITQLVDMNDGRREYEDNAQSFKQIADWAEKNL